MQLLTLVSWGPVAQCCDVHGRLYKRLRLNTGATGALERVPAPSLAMGLRFKHPMSWIDRTCKRRPLSHVLKASARCPGTALTRLHLRQAWM